MHGTADHGRGRLASRLRADVPLGGTWRVACAPPQAVDVSGAGACRVASAGGRGAGAPHAGTCCGVRPRRSAALPREGRSLLRPRRNTIFPDGGTCQGDFSRCAYERQVPCRDEIGRRGCAERWPPRKLHLREASARGRMRGCVRVVRTGVCTGPKYGYQANRAAGGAGRCGWNGTVRAVQGKRVPGSDGQSAIHVRAGRRHGQLHDDAALPHGDAPPPAGGLGPHRGIRELLLLRLRGADGIGAGGGGVRARRVPVERVPQAAAACRRSASRRSRSRPATSCS